MKKVLIPALLLSTVAVVNAASFDNGHVYVQGEGGYSALDTDKNINATHDIGSFGYAVRGGYEMPLSGPWSLGFEAGYINLGDSTFGAAAVAPGEMKFKQQGGDLLATATYHFDNGMNLFGKAGGAWISQKATLAGVSIGSKDKILPELAAGMGYDVNKNIALTATVNHIFGDSINVNTAIPVNAVASSTSVLAGIRFNIA